MKQKSVKSNIFYNIIIFMIIIIGYVFIFSNKGFIQIKEKFELLENKKETKTLLKQDINQISKNVERLKSDKEYILSYAKTFGYIDKANNEKIIRILRDESIVNRGTQTKPVNVGKPATENINILSVIILASMMFSCLIFYIIVVTKKKNQRYG